MARVTKILGLVALAVALSAVPAKAAFIDFLNSYWNPGSTTETSITRYVSSLDADLTITASGGANTLYWDNTDGFGVRGNEEDEVDKLEKLTLSFDKPVYLSSFNLTDLFYEGSRQYQEEGYYSLDGGAAVKFLADLSQVSGSTNGVKLISLNSGPVTTIEFYALNPVPEGQHHDFSVAGINASATPEPASLILVGSALGLGLWRRRRKFFN
ncbi:PEP-CTERM sorting domain-containing protein [Dethiosulfatarculus sandiegensis]|uniref:Uncharacterized protein n=1 Tax=Dethiosulfatarculus sandiegensis TaxID=1429043 RepID=A0A0D2J862_9BACT|nr:PEP-CTERM sorting domain-containing protein [Dethiosulfatarculus sandiegensis]KIX14369.1 hypothetical protein X474_09100 [Dethiosulfatarculus sandiegensis]